MELDNWHYNNFQTFRNIIFGKCFNEDNFYDKAKTIHQQEEFYEIREGSICEWVPQKKDGSPSPEDTFYAKMMKDGEYYIVPRRYLKRLPFMVTQYKEVRLKKSETQLYKFVTSVKSMKVPQKKTMSFRDFIKQFNPVENSNSKTATFLKLVAFSRGVKLGVCAPVACGKNSNMTLLSQQLGGFAPKIKMPTKAVFWQTLLYNNTLNVDEITSWGKASIALIEDQLVDIADDSPDTSKFSLDAYGKVSNADLTAKSMTFTFNPVSVQNKVMFHEKWSNADKILDRYPLLLVEGKVVGTINKPSSGEALDNVKKNLSWYKMQGGNSAYFYNNIHKELNGYSRAKSPFRFNSRFVSNTKGLLDCFDAFSSSQAEFDGWMIWLGACKKSYSYMVEGRPEEKVINERGLAEW